MNLHDALDKLDGSQRKEGVRNLIDAFIAVGRDRRSRLVPGQVDGESRMFRVAPRLNHYGCPRSETEVRVSLIPKNRVNGRDHDF